MSDTQDPVYARLLKAALECFLADEYHKVTTRLIAEKAVTNISMIRYYFGNKEGLYEEMIRETMKPVLDVLDSDTMTHVGDLAEYLRVYYDTMRKHPEFPKLILKVLALNHGPPLHPAAAGTRPQQRGQETGSAQGRRASR